MNSILIVDCGGTNVRFALVEGHENTHRIAHEKILQCADYQSFFEASSDYLKGMSHPPKAAVMAFACPVRGAEIKLTNNSWSFKKSTLAQFLNCPVIFLNDLEAMAWSLLNISDECLLPVACQAKPKLTQDPAVVVAPGTGLGVGALLPKQAHVIVGEGGHATLAPTTDYEAEILRYLRHKLGHVSGEKCLSGQGIVNLYDAVSAIDGLSVSCNNPVQIASLAREGDASSLQTFMLFASFLGNVSGNLAVSFGSFSGIYLGGGVLEKTQDLFNEALFRQKFEEKGRFKDYLSQIPSFLIHHSYPGFSGLQAYIAHHPEIWK